MAFPRSPRLTLGRHKGGPETVRRAPLRAANMTVSPDADGLVALKEWGDVNGAIEALAPESAYASHGKLIMVLVVQNDEDIVSRVIDFHLAQGVDEVVAVACGSTDRSRIILEDYQARGWVHIAELDQDGRSAVELMNELARIAVAEHAAEAVFCCRGDEFWLARGSDLRSELLACRSDVVSVPVLNVLMQDAGRKEDYLQHARYLVARPFESQDLENDSKVAGVFLFRGPSRYAFCNVQACLPRLGEDGLAPEGHGGSQASADGVLVVRYPVRSWRQFVARVQVARACPMDDAGLRFYWQRCVEKYKRNDLVQEYQMLTLNQEEADYLMQRGVIVPVADAVISFAGGLPYGFPRLRSTNGPG